jgi:hypothetical protein
VSRRRIAHLNDRENRHFLRGICRFSTPPSPKRGAREVCSTAEAFDRPNHEWPGKPGLTRRSHGRFGRPSRRCPKQRETTAVLPEAVRTDIKRSDPLSVLCCES